MVRKKIDIGESAEELSEEVGSANIESNTTRICKEEADKTRCDSSELVIRGRDGNS